MLGKWGIYDQCFWGQVIGDFKMDLDNASSSM